MRRLVLRVFRIMKVIDLQFYNPDPDELEELEGNKIPFRPKASDLVSIWDGDGELFGRVRWDMASEVCRILNWQHAESMRATQDSD